MRRGFTGLLAILLATVLVAAACGGDDEPTTTAPAAPAPAADDGAADAPAPAPADADAEAPADAPAEPPPPPPPGAEDITAALVFDIGGRGDQSFNDSAAAGLDRAAAELGVNTTEASPNPDGSNRAELLQLSADGAELVIGVGFLFGESIAEVAANNPDTLFGIIDSAPEGTDNLAGLVFAEHEGSFLVGAAAALKSNTGTVGFIGGVDIPLIRKFHAGFEAGVHAVDPNIRILDAYVTEPPDFDGWSQPAEGKIIGQSMYEAGADVIYHAAGGTGAGLFEAAKEFSEAGGSKVWAIGVDSDQYNTSAEEVRPYILTSMLKRVDVAVYNTIESVVNGDFTGGTTVFNLAVDGVGYSTTGGFVDDIVPELERFKEAIVGGTIVVPETTERGGGEDVTAALVFDIGGRGDQSFNDSAAAGLDRAADFLRINPQESSPNPDGSNRAELLQLSADGADLVIGVGFLFGESITEVATNNPDTYFGIIDSFPAELPNLAGLTFAEHEGSFLVGAAAALKSNTGTVGFIGGVDIPIIRKFHAGFEAGVYAVDPNIEILAAYVTEPPDFDGWSQPAEGKIIGQSMYEAGADVIYHAAGGTGAGLFEAAKEFSEAGDSKVWAIGVDSDQYWTSAEEVRPYILSSMLKRVDVAVYNTIEAVVNGTFSGGLTVFDLSVNGVGYSISGGFINDIIPQLEEFKQAIIRGDIVVPETTG
ncbi:MAG: BMP family ABC transporter substrate-binding protein [Acidimicrobiia bacterium]|nr:BMP family ABC transporter substrate-binding protein [Acidimicrobiia bacterium]